MVSGIHETGANQICLSSTQILVQKELTNIVIAHSYVTDIEKWVNSFRADFI